MATKRSAFIATLFLSLSLLPSAWAADPEYVSSTSLAGQGGQIWRVSVPRNASVTFNLGAILNTGGSDQSAAVFGLSRTQSGEVISSFGFGTVVDTLAKNGQPTHVRLLENRANFLHPSTGRAWIGWHGVGTYGTTSPRDEPWTLVLGGFANAGADYVLTLEGLGTAPLTEHIARGTEAVTISTISDSDSLVSSDGLGGAVTTGSRWNFHSSGTAFFMGVPTYDDFSNDPAFGRSELPNEFVISPPDGTTRCSCDFFDDRELWNAAVSHYTADRPPGIPPFDVDFANQVTSAVEGEWRVNLSASVSPTAHRYRVWFFDLGSV